MAEARVACGRSWRPVRVFSGRWATTAGQTRATGVGGANTPSWPISSERSEVTELACRWPRRVRSGKASCRVRLRGHFIIQSVTSWLCFAHHVQITWPVLSPSSHRPRGATAPFLSCQGGPRSVRSSFLFFFKQWTLFAGGRLIPGQLPPFLGRVRSRKENPCDSRLRPLRSRHRRGCWFPGWHSASRGPAPPLPQASAWGRCSCERQPPASGPGRAGAGCRHPPLFQALCLMSGRHEKYKQFCDVSPSFTF